MEIQSMHRKRHWIFTNFFKWEHYGILEATPYWPISFTFFPESLTTNSNTKDLFLSFLGREAYRMHCFGLASLLNLVLLWRFILIVCNCPSFLFIVIWCFILCLDHKVVSCFQFSLLQMILPMNILAHVFWCSNVQIFAGYASRYWNLRV